MFTVTIPSAMNETFARAFNSRDINNLMLLYEDNAVLQTDAGAQRIDGLDAIRAELTNLLQAPGKMRSVNNFCLEHGDLALLRADWSLTGDDGQLVAWGSSAEVVRRQQDGTWRYLIDHAVGASVPKIAD
mgnify:CR=1 FL=1